jgi:hypothetical protein
LGLEGNREAVSAEFSNLNKEMEVSCSNRSENSCGWTSMDSLYFMSPPPSRVLMTLLLPAYAGRRSDSAGD